ncbi:MAG: hypothetical protein KDB03_25110 [Planctomycetales bacterium]|nr:hypothetical protein [Planctomycetales bacterium]
MTRINTNVSSLVAQNRLNKTNSDLQTSLTRLSTGLRINTGKDDPAGLIASEALRSDITSINKAISNTQRATQIIATADSALGQVSSLLNDIRGLVTEAANSGALSDDEIAANQLQIDSSLEAINRISQTTTFQGRRLLDGSLDFITRDGTGYNTVADIKIDQANLGSSGSISVNVEIASAATKATISSTGIPAATTAVQSSGTITFTDDTPDTNAAGSVSLANAYTIGAEATGSITFANAWTPGNEAGGTLTLGNSGVTVDIDAIDAAAADGAFGNGVIIDVTTIASGTSSGTYDANTNTLSLTIVEGDSGATIQGHLAADTNINSIFAFTNGAGAASNASDAGTYTGVLSGGTNTTNPATGFTLTAADGGEADGVLGNTTDVVFTSGAANGASYDAGTNILTVTVAAGATISDIANAINTEGNFVASNTVNGTYNYDVADNGTDTDPLASGTSPTAAASFTLEAVSGGQADGTLGNATSLVFQTGATTAAEYDSGTNTLTVSVADGDTVDDVIAAINSDLAGDFLAKSPLNGTSIFSATDFGTTTPLSGGTDTTIDDVITVTADEATPNADGVTITLNSDNSLAAGEATAEIDDDGNIIVNVSSNGSVAIGTIASAINDLDGFGATVTTSDADGYYDIVNDTTAVTADLAGGVFGGGINDDLVVQITGATGGEVFQFEKGASLSSIIASINLVSDATSIVASNDSGNLKLTSSHYGSNAFIDVEVISEGTDGTFESGLTAKRSNGTDIVATVNGTAATSQGNTLSINTATLDLSLTVDDGSSTSVNFDITGGGALFQLGGEVVSNQQARLGISSLSTGKLGGVNGRLYELASGQAKSLVNDVVGAGRVIDEVINKVTSLRGRLGAFQATTLESNLVSLNDTVANLTEAESSIRDADFAQESARLTRAQILVQSGTSVLGIANQNPQNVLALLR